MFDKKLIRLVHGIMPLIVKKSAVMWLSLLCGIGIWLSLAYLIASARTDISGAVICACAAAAALCALLRYILARVTANIGADIADKAKTDLRAAIYDKTAVLGGEYAKGFSTAEIMQLASEGVEQTENYFVQYLPQLFYAVAAPLTLFCVFMAISPAAAAVLLICVPLIPAAIMSVQTAAKRLLSKYWDAYMELGDTFLENMEGLTTLKIYGADGDMHKKMNDESERFRKITMKVLSMQLNSVTIMDLVACGGAAAGIIAVYSGFAAGNVSFFGAVAAVFLSAEFFVPMRLLGSYFHIAMNGVAAGKKISDLLEIVPPSDGTETAENGDIEICGMDFSYGDRKVLNNISAVIRRNTVIGICGESGCGKSTLAAIISARLREYSGQVRLNGAEYSSLSAESIRKTVTYAGCGDYIFSGTVREIFADADENASDDMMYSALERVNMADFTRDNGGLDMRIAQNASNLSGGQRQRLSLARAFLKNSDIYIFDEITSNIDAQSERIILDAVRETNKTIVMISHKLTNIADADMIYYMNSGTITESGSHEELIARGGEYCRVYEYQKELENYSERSAK